MIKFTILLSLLQFSLIQAINFTRIKAEFTIKEKAANGSQYISTGTAYFDKFFNRVIYITRYPVKETMVITDSVMYQIRNNKVINKKTSPSSVKNSIFLITLNGQLSSFGLDGSIYKISKVEKEKDLIITTWTPSDKYRDIMGKILLSTKNKKLHGVVILNKESKVLSKQFFKNYINIAGIDFPTEVLQIIYSSDNKENYKITTYKNITLNDFKENSNYSFPIPR